MNFLVLFPEEIKGDTARLDAARADYVKRVHSVEPGKTYSTIILNRGAATSSVHAVGDSHVTFFLQNIVPAALPEELDLVVGVSRPQTVRKVLQAAVSFGVRRLTFLRSATAEKSYLQASILLHADRQNQILLEAAEQTGAWYFPEVAVEHRFMPFVQDVLAPRIAVPGCQGILGTIGDRSTDLSESFRTADSRIVCIGPEKGWSPHEQAALIAAGCAPVSVGPRMLRVEIAAVALLALSVVRHQSVSYPGQSVSQ